MKVTCRVTRYAVRNDRLQETPRDEETNVMVETMHGQDWILLGNSSASIPIEKAELLVRQGRGWPAQSGTKPVKVERIASCETPMMCCGPVCQAGWGGRNYPTIYVTKPELRLLVDCLKAVL